MHEFIQEIVEETRTPDMVPDPLTMWDQLVDLCETEADLVALMVMREQAEG